jgi:uncharacterized membrane protein HdeD (DUF308 family)
MTRSTDGGRTIDRLTDPSGTEKRWRYLAVVGGVFVVIGLLVMAFPVVFGTAIRLVIGTGFLVTGAPLIWHAVRSQGSVREFGVDFVLGVFYAGAGVALLTNAGGGVVGLIGIFVTVSGLLLVVFGVRQRPNPGWVFPVAGGGVSALFGVLVWIGWPNSEPATVGVLAGLALVATGGPLIVLAQRLRRQVGRQSRPEA